MGSGARREGVRAAAWSVFCCGPLCALCLVATGCGTAALRYSPNAPLYLKPHTDLTVQVKAVDNLPMAEKSGPYSTLDGAFSDLLAHVVAADVQASGVFRSVVAESQHRRDIDLLLLVRANHFIADEVPAGNLWLAFATAGIVNPLYVKMLKAKGHLDLDLSLVDPATSDVLWKDEVSEQWKSDPYSAVSVRGTPQYTLLYQALCERLRTRMKAVIERMAAKMKEPSTRAWLASHGRRQQEAASIPESARPAARLGGGRDAFAVVVGISRYQHASKHGIANLAYADEDARAFAAALKKLGWADDHIRLLTNGKATQRDVVIALESWLTKAGPDDLIVLFWSGHGFPDPEDPEKVYFACYDTDIKIPATGYRMDKVRAALEERRARNVIVLADTCHAGKLITRGHGEKDISIVPHLEKMRREKSVPRGWIFMVGADSDRKAIEDTSWTNGAFTHCLLKGLAGQADGFQSVGLEDRIVTMGELRAYLSTAMPQETQKVLGVAKRPVITTSTGDPHIWTLSLQKKQR